MMEIMVYQLTHLEIKFYDLKKEGKDGVINFEGNTSKFFQDIGLANEKGAAIHIINEAQNAEYTINGITGSSSTNTVEALPGVKIELLKVTEQK